MSDNRKVTRVLVLLDYGPADAESGEVFDLTALALEVANKTSHKQASIILSVDTHRDYSQSSPWPIYLTAAWSAMANYNSSARSGHLDDAINASMPDSLTTENMKKTATRIRKRLDKLNDDIQIQRLRDVASVRHQFPIARVKETALLTVGKSKGQA